MLEEIIKEYLKVQGISYKYGLTPKQQSEIHNFCYRRRPDKAYINTLREFADKYDIPAFLLVRAMKYEKMEEL